MIAHGPERELTAPIDLCGADGRIAPAAIGWTRRPLHTCAIAGPWGRRKRWHYWAIVSAREIISLTVADLDYVGAAIALVIDRETGQAIQEVAVRPLGWRVPLPTRADQGRVVVAHGRARFDFDDRGARVALDVRTRRLAIEVEIDRPADHDTLGVAVARAPHLFAYTGKHVALPARGTVAIDGVARPIAAGAFACLDWGRGVWPARSRWNWAAAAGVDGGRTIGFNLGAQWTDGGGATENAVVVDGRLAKLATEVRFEFDRRAPRAPWHLRGPEVDLRFTPAHVRHPRAPLGPLGSELCLGFGTFTGRVGDAAVRDLSGWAEDLRVTW